MPEKLRAKQLRDLNKAWGRTKIENNYRLFKTQKELNFYSKIGLIMLDLVKMAHT